MAALLAEYEFVSGLIPLYRGVEIRALSALGLSVGAIVSIFVALAEQPDADIAVLTGILSFATWLFVLFATIEVTASLRIKRASTYIGTYLYPRLDELAPQASLKWESTRALDLIGVGDDARMKHARNRLRKTLVTSGPLSLGIGIAGFIVGVISIWVLLISDRTGFNPAVFWLYIGVGALGGALSGLLGIYGAWLTREVERENQKVT